MNNTKNMITWVTIIAIGIAGIILAASPKKEPVLKAGEHSGSSEQSYDFGKISMAKGNVSHAFEVKNNSSEPLKIEKIYTSCMCTTALLAIGDELSGPFGMPGHGMIPPVKKTLSPGATASLEVIFDPQAHGPAGLGKVERIVYVETGDGEVQEFKFTAEVAP